MYRIAVVGATGAVGEALFEAIEHFDLPVKQVYALAGERSVGKTVMFRGSPIHVEALNKFDFSQADLAFFSAGAKVSAEWVEQATACGCIVIDNTSHFRYQDDVPLVVPEVNPQHLADYKKRLIIANPNCSTIQMLVALKPIYDRVGISKINVTTFQAVSGSGRRAITELVDQTSTLLTGTPVENPVVYPVQIAFNVIPAIDEAQANGYTREEMKLVWETRKIFNDPDIAVNPTAVRVPVLYGHSEAINITMNSPLSAAQARELLGNSPGITVVDDLSKQIFPTPITHGSGAHDVAVGRIREELDDPLGLNLWVVADNVRKGAASNSVQIAQLLIKDYL